MASSCHVCLQRQTTSPPHVFCYVCNEVLCESCTKDHRSHDIKDNLLPYKDYQKIPQFILKANLKCFRHGKIFTNFCRIHDEAICKRCRKKNHRKCEDAPKIEDIVDNVKTCVAFEDIIIEIGSMCDTLSNITKDRDRNLKQLKSKRKKIQKKIEKKIDSVINFLLELKTEKITDLNSVYDTLTNEITSTTQTVQSDESKLRTMLDQKDDILKHAADYQTFFGIKEIEETILGINNSLKVLSEHEKLLEYNLKFEINQAIKDMCDIQSLGNIRVIKSPSAVSIKTTKPRDLEAVKAVNAPVQLSLQQTICLENGYYFGSCALQSGLMAFPDYKHNQVYIYHTDGSLRSTIKFKDSEGVHGVTPVDEHHVAVSHPWSDTISIFNLVSEKVVKSLKTKWKVRGLCCQDKYVVCCVKDEGLIRVNMDTEEVDRVVEDETVDSLSQVKVSDSIICYSCPETETLTVMDTQYNVIFTFKDKAVLDGPMGVAIDNNNNIYVSGYYSHNLVVITQDGKISHQLLGKNNELQVPTSVHFDSSTKKLMAVNLMGPSYIYSVR